ncbi:MAG: isoprenyl transferase [Spirochaetota bacterium]
MFKHDYSRKIDYSRAPEHVAIIMDGNGRWAQKRKLPRIEGHRRGSETMENLMDAAVSLNIKVVSLYAFSTENWTRPEDEVKGLWQLLQHFFESKLPLLKEKNIQVRHSGNIQDLPTGARKVIREAVRETKNNDSIILNFCLNYGGREEIITAAEKWADRRKNAESLDSKTFEKYLYTHGLPDVDLLIRTSGEYRISNFLLWQIAYAELVFMEVFWPDFTPWHLYKAVYMYQKRERRFGGL